jgi:heme a synthase
MLARAACRASRPGGWLQEIFARSVKESRPANPFPHNRSSLATWNQQAIRLANSSFSKQRCYSITASRDRVLGRIIEPRFFSSNAATEEAAPTPVPPSVGRWLLLSSSLVFAVIVVGGVTRLTESGLSITEWRPITGILPPLSRDAWAEEFQKYQATPEFKM